MYDDYMQNLMEMNYYPFSNTYESYNKNLPFFCQTEYMNPYDYTYNQSAAYNFQKRNTTTKNIISDLEDLYPEIYKIVYPMVKKSIEKISKPVTNDLIEDLANDIYSHLEAENITNLNININSNNNIDASSSNSQNSRNNPSEEKRESRQRYNPVLDLIRILLIRELIDNPGHMRPRPPRPIHHRPPFSQRPDMFGPPPPPPMPRY